MKKYMLLTYGFEKPTPEIMAAWGKWFESIAGNMVDKGGVCSGGREISQSGTQDLAMGIDSFTGYVTVTANSLDEAERLAQGCPIIKSIVVYEIR